MLVLDALGHSVPGVVVEPAEVRLELEVEQGEQGDGPVVKVGTSE